MEKQLILTSELTQPIWTNWRKKECRGRNRREINEIGQGNRTIGLVDLIMEL